MLRWKSFLPFSSLKRSGFLCPINFFNTCDFVLKIVMLMLINYWLQLFIFLVWDCSTNLSILTMLSVLVFHTCYMICLPEILCQVLHFLSITYFISLHVVNRGYAECSALNLPTACLTLAFAFTTASVSSVEISMHFGLCFLSSSNMTFILRSCLILIGHVWLELQLFLQLWHHVMLLAIISLWLSMFPLCSILLSSG